METQLNGLVVPSVLAALMDRPDWDGRRTGEAWLQAFGSPPSGFVDLIGWSAASWESRGLHLPGSDILKGVPDRTDPPGDIDATTCFVIGFVDYVDATIAVDTRPEGGPRIISAIYGTGPRWITYRTAFPSMDHFASFYREQHGS